MKILHLLRRTFSRRFRQIGELIFVESQIEVLKKEIASTHKLASELKVLPQSLRDDLRHNQKLLGDYSKRVIELRGKIRQK